MIFGKTYIERHLELKQFIEDVDSGELNGWKRFAFLPVRLNDGRRVWFQSYYVFWKVYTSYGVKHIETDNYRNSHNRPVEYKFLTREEGFDALHKTKR